MASILLFLASASTSPAGRRALELAGAMAGDGHALTLCCLQDAVLLGSDRATGEARAALGRLLDGGGRLVVLGEDLQLRGLRAGSHARTVDMAGLVERLADAHDRVIGAL